MNFPAKYFFQVGEHVAHALLLLLVFFSIITNSSFASQTERALLTPLAAKSLILDLANAGQRTVAVGWRGHILVSEDDAQSWQQVEAPTKSMLTSVYFLDKLQGWAVGHGSVILGTEDGGQNWKLLSASPEEERPLFDVIVTDEYGFAIGAYAKLMISKDGGKNWTPGEFVIEKSIEEANQELDDEESFPFDFHLNGIARSATGTLYIAAEAGYLFRSDNNGRTWKELPSPYGGSFFGILPLEGKTLLVYGLRGHIFRSEDGGESWEQIETGTTALLTDATRLSDGTTVITGMAGVILISSDRGRSFTLQQPDRISLTSAITTKADTLVVAGERGFKTVNKTLYQVSPESDTAGSKQ